MPFDISLRELSLGVYVCDHTQATNRRGGRAAEGAPLLREYGLKAHRGFESLPLRQPILGPFRDSTVLNYCAVSHIRSSHSGLDPGLFEYLLPGA